MQGGSHRAFFRRVVTPTALRDRHTFNPIPMAPSSSDQLVNRRLQFTFSSITFITYPKVHSLPYTGRGISDFCSASAKAHLPTFSIFRESSHPSACSRHQAALGTSQQREHCARRSNMSAGLYRSTQPSLSKYEQTALHSLAVRRFARLANLPLRNIHPSIPALRQEPLRYRPWYLVPFETQKSHKTSSPGPLPQTMLSHFG